MEAKRVHFRCLPAAGQRALGAVSARQRRQAAVGRDALGAAALK